MQVESLSIGVKKNRLIITFARADPLLDLHKTVRRVKINQMTVRWIIREERLLLYKISFTFSLFQACIIYGWKQFLKL